MKFKSLLLVVGFIPAMVMAQAPVTAKPVTQPVATAPVAVKPTPAPAKPALSGEQNNIFNDIQAQRLVPRIPQPPVSSNGGVKPDAQAAVNLPGTINSTKQKIKDKLNIQSNN